MAVAIVQHAQGSPTHSSGTSATDTISFASNITPGNCVVAAITLSPVGNVVDISSITTNGSADHWVLGVNNNDSTNIVSGSIYVDPNSVGGTKNVVISYSFNGTASSTETCGICVDLFELSGVVSVSAVDKTNSATADNVTSWSSGSSGTTTQGTEFVIGLLADTDEATATVTGPSSPWNNESEITLNLQSQGAPFQIHQLCGYQIVSSTGSFTYSGTLSATNSFSGYVAAVLTLKGTTNVTVAIPAFASTQSWKTVTPSFNVTVAIPAFQSTQQWNPVTPVVFKNLVAGISAGSVSDGFTNTLPGGIAAVAANGATYVRLVNIAGVPQLNSSAGNAPASTGGAMVGVVPVNQSDTSTFTVTATAQTQFSKNWSIPLADLAVNAVYRLTAFGIGTQGSTQRQLNWFFSAFGNSAYAPLSFATTVIATSTGFQWRLVAEFLCTAHAGTSYTFLGAGRVTIATGSAITTSNAATGAWESSLGAQTITTATNLELGVGWASNAATLATITCNGSILEKVV